MANNTTSTLTSAEQSFTISLFRSKKDASAKLSRETWPQLVKRFSAVKVRAEKDGPLFSPATFAPAHRAKENVKDLSLLVLDYDDDAQIGAAVETWQRRGLCFLLYTTHSHQRKTEGHDQAEDCFRVVIPLSEPIGTKDYPQLWDWANQISGRKLDQACKDASRMYYLPSKVSKDAPFDFQSIEGEFLNWRSLEPDGLAIEKGTPTSKTTADGRRELNKRIARILSVPKDSHERNVTLNREAYWLGHFVARGDVQESEAIEALQRAARQIGLEEAEIMPTIKSGLYDGIAKAQIKAEHVVETESAAAQGQQNLTRSVIVFAGTTAFQVDQKGVWATQQDEDNRQFICSPLYIEANTRDERNEQWGRLLRIVDRDGQDHIWSMPMSMLSGDGQAYRERLLDMGLVLAPGRKSRILLETYLHTDPGTKARCVEKIGWHNGAYILPEESIGTADGERICLQASSGSNHLLQSSCKAEEWREHIGQYCISNTRLVFSVSLAFAASLLDPLQVESGGFHFTGKTSKGKTTLQYVAGSVWGGGTDKGYLKRWRTTSNGLENVAEYHNDSLLCLDEIGECDPHEADQIAYMLANGQGKIRAGRNHGLRRVLEWRLLFLSSGEISLAEHMAKVGKKTQGRQEVRIINLEADAGSGMGVFEELHDFKKSKDAVKDGDAFAKHLKQASIRYYGAPIRAFLDRMIKQNLLTKTRLDYQKFKQEFINSNAGKEMSSEVSRALERFALVAYAGELATSIGITGWPEGEASTSASVLFHQWIRARGTFGSTEEEAGLRQVRAFIERNGHRFRRIKKGSDQKEQWEDSHIPFNQIGYIKPDDDDNISYYHFSTESFRAEVCAGFDCKDILDALNKRGFLDTNIGRNDHRIRIPEKKTSITVYSISASILE